MDKPEDIFELAVIEIHSEEGKEITMHNSNLILEGPYDKATAIKDFISSYKYTHPLYVVKSGDQYFLYS